MRKLLFALITVLLALSLASCDGGADGCKHASTETTEGVKATCTESGLSDGVTCKDCGEVVKEQKVIPALGHDDLLLEGKAPTCTEAGWSDYTSCFRCGLETKETLDALGHKDANGDGMCETCKQYLNVQHTVTVTSLGGLKLKGVSVSIYAADDAEGKVSLGTGKTDKNGNFKIDLSIMQSYRVEVNSAPAGYKLVEGVTFDSEYNASIQLESAPIQDGFADLPADFYYEVGDVIHDFSLTDINGNTVSVSEVLGEQDLLVLNFWYIECPYCLWEFPYISDAYNAFNANGKKVEIFAINDAGNTHDSVKDFVAAPWDIEDNPFETPNFPFFVASDSGYAEVSIISKFVEDKSRIGYPLSVFIDRYGVICCIEMGAMPDSDVWTAAFEHFTSKNYSQVLLESIKELSEE